MQWLFVGLALVHPKCFATEKGLHGIDLATSESGDVLGVIA